MRAALRRRAEPEPFLLGELAIHYDDRRVTLLGRPVTLTLTEYELLRVLSLNAGWAVAFDTLVRQAWGGRHADSPDPQLVRAVVRRLHRKLGDEAPTRPGASRRYTAGPFSGSETGSVRDYRPITGRWCGAACLLIPVIGIEM